MKLPNGLADIWEADLMMFERDLGKANVTTLTERKSRYNRVNQE